MKFQLVIEPDGKRLILLPETSGEAQILQAIAGDPAGPGIDVTPSRSAKVQAEWSADRAPYKKLIKIRITFGEVDNDC